MRPRPGLTIVELLVILAIVATVIALVFPAIQMVRAAAMQMQCNNQMRQIGLALHHYSSDRGGQLPNVGINLDDFSFHGTILPYLEHGSYYQEVMAGTRSFGSNYVIKQYLCPLDPSPGVAGDVSLHGRCNYAANAQAFLDRPSITHSFKDGVSSTVALAERYVYALGTPVVVSDWFHYLPPLYFTQVPGGLVARQATFAHFPIGTQPYDPLKDDVYPITSGNPPTSVGSIPELTFQVRPRPTEADARIPQTGHPSGMPVLMMDGRVVTLRRGVAPEVFWGLVTPRGGEAVELPD